MAKTKIFKEQIKDETIVNSVVSNTAGIKWSKVELIDTGGLLFASSDGKISQVKKIRFEKVKELPNDVITDFTFDFVPIAGTLKVFLNGVLQAVSIDYTVILITKTITFINPPPANSLVHVSYLTQDFIEQTGTQTILPGDSIMVEPAIEYESLKPDLKMTHGAIMFLHEGAKLKVNQI